METKQWDNEERRRYYGIRVGDIVRSNYFQQDQLYEVWGYGFMDNNSVHLIEVGKENARPFPHVAEWLTIVTKVEDKKI